MYNYTTQATHHAKFDFDPTTWVVWANSHFATASGVFLPSFLPSFLSFYLRVRAVLATATWLAGPWLAVRHSRYCIKTTKPILKLFGPSGSPII